MRNLSLENTSRAKSTSTRFESYFEIYRTLDVFALKVQLSKIIPIFEIFDAIL